MKKHILVAKRNVLSNEDIARVVLIVGLIMGIAFNIFVCKSIITML